LVSYLENIAYPSFENERSYILANWSYTTKPSTGERGVGLINANLNHRGACDGAVDICFQTGYSDLYDAEVAYGL
jgi:hypothetical protein